MQVTSETFSNTRLSFYTMSEVGPSPVMLADFAD